ncbi:MAG TPA: TetR/AcrR family transcriptional regulator [Duganella sp.]|uniref:TetR/AcrR family transcriptional regulator n=1 Tax=Duganella sp. TaxID=1904440 RepID=UPI002ED09625
MNVEKQSIRDRLFDAASQLFYAEGIRGVGVEAIAKAARTTKMGLYRHFESKDVLITEWVGQLVAQYAAVMDGLEARYPDDARGQLMGFAEFIADDVARASYRGCPFINTIAELPDVDHPARQLIEAHKARQLRRIGALCAKAGVAEPKLAAIHLTLLLEGAQTAAQNGSVPRLRENLLKLAEMVLNAV